MSTHSIPHLGTLRKGARGGARSGFVGRTNHVDKDAVIRSTDGDAASSRISAAEAGYLDDPFAKYVTDENWQRRLPLMNRGTYVRTSAIDLIVDTFLASNDGPKQIISFGAGSDTRYFRLKRDKKHTDFTYHELDFAENNKTKIARLTTPQCLQTIETLCDVDLKTAQVEDNELCMVEYSIHSVDLRNLPGKIDWLEPKKPTLLISECCLIYLSPEEADRALSYFSDLFTSTSLSVVIYEPFRPNDSFGRTMIRNLTTRGIVLQTIEKYADLKTQLQRLSNLGFTARAADTAFVWQEWVNADEKERIDKLEWMDEVEEFVLLAKHYCIAWGWRNQKNDTQWRDLPNPTA